MLAETAKRKQESVGWKIVTDIGTGARLGMPTKLVPQQATDANGTQMDVAHRHRPDPAVAAQGSQPHHRQTRRAREEGAGRPQDRLHRGQAGFLRAVGTAGPEEILRARHLQGRRGPHPDHPLRSGRRKHRGAGGDRDVERVQPVSGGRATAGPPPRKTVEYGTGIVVSGDGAIVTDRQITDGCLAIAIAGYGNADRIAEDKDHDLALLRIYGARGLKPINLGGGAAKTNSTSSGIADPQNQGGAAAVSSVKASVARDGGSGDPALSPAPALGFSGAAGDR